MQTTTQPHGPSVLASSRYVFAAERAQTLKNTLPSKTVYDVGAGQGMMREPLEAAGLRWRPFDAYPHFDSVTKWNLDDPCPSGRAEAGLVVLLDVIEHLRNPGLGLLHLAATLLPQGCLLLTTPNPRWSRSRLEAVRSGFPTCFTQGDLDGNGHVFPAWPHITRRLLEEAGLVVEEYVTLDGRTRWPRFHLSVHYPLRAIHAAANMFIESRDPSACGMSYGMIARKPA